ncbi:MAG: YIP1 family protein [Clostridia bacterium]|nr:YIP1 family protein [Clostridia bacterium]
MGNFCTYCGKQLVDGQICSCRENNSVPAGNPAENVGYGQQPNQFQGQGNPYPGQNNQFPGQNNPYPGGQSNPYPGQQNQYPAQGNPFPAQGGQNPGQINQYPGQGNQYPGQPSHPYNPGHARTNQFNASQAAGQFANYSKNMLQIGLQLFKKPVGVLKEVGKNEDFKTGLFFVLIQAVIAGIFAMIAAKSLFSLLGFSSFSAFGFKINYFATFIKAVLLVGIQFFVLSGAVFATAKFAFGNTGSFKSVIAVIGTASIPISAATLIAIPVIVILPGFAYGLVYFGMIASILLNYSGIKNALDVDENKAVYLITIAYAVYSIILWLFTKQLFMPSMNDFSF